MRTTNIVLLLALCLTSFFCFPSRHGFADAPSKPNIVFIFADDCGIDTFSCYGSTRFHGMTPNIDKLASEGIQFERCFACPVCGPSRCLIMTGRYGFRTGATSNQTTGNAKYTDEPSLAKVLNAAGYVTGMAGKWRQMSDSPGDWGFKEFVTDPTAGGYFWESSYTKNGQEIKSPTELYYPDVASDFAVDFITRHKNEPFYFYLSDHLIHGKVLKTPDSKPDATPDQLYDDTLLYLDKTVGKIVATLDRLQLRERTLIIFSTDNGTSTVGYSAEHDPRKQTGLIGGRHIFGHKGELLEGGGRVPLIANWKGVTPVGQHRNDLIDFSDLLPTFAEIAGGSLPKEFTFDGRSFAPQIRGETGNPRDWIFVQLGLNWYARSSDWKVNSKGELYSMKDAPFAEYLVAPNAMDDSAKSAKASLDKVLAALAPETGKLDAEKGRGTKNKTGKKKKKQTTTSAN